MVGAHAQQGVGGDGAGRGRSGQPSLSKTVTPVTGQVRSSRIPGSLAGAAHGDAGGGVDYRGGVKIDPVALLSRTLEHLRANPEGHVLMGVAQFVLVNLLTFGMICCGMCGGMFVAVPAAIASAAAGADPDAAGGVATAASLLVYPLMGLGMVAILPAITLVYASYQVAVLDEVDGKGKVSLGKVGGVLTGSLGALLGITLLQCGASMVGVMLCYVGIFLTALPLKFVHLVRHDRQVGVMDAVGIAWDGFRAEPATHAAVFVTEIVMSMVLAYIPLIGPMILWPTMAVFDSMAYRALYPVGAAAAPVATATTPG